MTSRLHVPRALTIAGSDSGGGAGIQADLKTFAAFGVYGMSAITAITAQNTQGVVAAQELPVALIQAQIRAVAEDIGVDALKTGMLASPEIVVGVAATIRELRLKNLVVDPVMVAKGGHPLLAPAAQETVARELLPLASVVTPNLFEASILVGFEVRSLDDMQRAAKALIERGVAWAVVKGGHLEGAEAVDVVYDGREFSLLRAPRIDTTSTHGTGCTFSAAIAAGLAKGQPPLKAIERAKDFVTAAIASAADLGHGHGPTNHLAGVSSRWM